LVLPMLTWCVWQSAVGGGALVDCRGGCEEPRDRDDIDGMELQDGDGDGRTLDSHWSQRHAKDEWMAPIGSAVYRTELTLAAPADLGCMRAEWEMAEPMRW
ncbi:surface protease GP63, partial [Trypanosoma cruzi]